MHRSHTKYCQATINVVWMTPAPWLVKVKGVGWVHLDPPPLAPV